MYKRVLTTPRVLFLDEGGRVILCLVCLFMKGSLELDSRGFKMKKKGKVSPVHHDATVPGRW